MTWNEGHFVENVFERERVDAVLRGRLFATGRADKDAVLASVEVVEELSRNRREVTGQRFLSAAHCVVGAAAGHMNVLSADSLNSLHRIVRTVRSNHDTVIADEMWRTLYIGLCTSFAQEDDADTAILHHLAGLPLLTACVLCEVLHRGGGGIPAGTAERIFTRVDHALRGDNDALREEAMSRHLWLLFQRYTFFWKTREFFRVAASVRTALVARLQEATPSEMHIHQQVFSLISVQRILDEHPRLGNVRMGPSEAAFLELLNPSTLTSLASRAARDVLATFFLFERDALDNKRDPVITQAAHPILHSTLMSDILPNALEQIVAGGAGRMRLMSVVQAAGWVDLLLTRLSQDEGGPTEGKGYRVPVAAVFVAVFASLHNLEVQGERKEAKEGHRLQSLHDTVVRLFKGEEKLSMQASYLAQTSRLSESGGGMLLVDTSSSYLQHITQRDIVAMHRLLMNASHCTSLGETFCKNVRLYAAQANAFSCASIMLLMQKMLFSPSKAKEGVTPLTPPCIPLTQTTTDTPPNMPDLLPYPTQLLQACGAHPEKVAFICDGRRYSYASFRDMAYAVATELSGVAVGVHVAICVEKGMAWVASCAACSFLGLPYTLLAPRMPEAQLRQIWDTWQPMALLVDDAGRNVLPKDILTLDRIVDVTQVLANTRPGNTWQDLQLPQLLDLNLPAFVDWTTGTSTGKVKGVITRHRHLAQMLQWRVQNYPFAAGEVVAVNQFPLWYWWMAPAVGCTTALVPDAVLIDSQLFLSMVSEAKVTRVDCTTPSLLRVWLQDSAARTALSTLRLVVVSGEGLPVETARLFHSTLSCALLNLLSTTEAGDVASLEVTPHIVSWLETAERPFCPVGCSMLGVTISASDDHAFKSDTPLLELRVSGTGVPDGAGYIGDQEANQNFVTNPRTQTRTWCTKDAAAVLPIPSDALRAEDFVGACFKTVAAEGTKIYELTGRLNMTAKVRGFRVDLASIQLELRKVPVSVLGEAVLDAVVLVHDDELIAFIKSRTVHATPGGPHAAVTSLRAHLKSADVLPSFAHPSHYVFIADIPVTATGKTNAKKLLEDHIKATERNVSFSVAPDATHDEILAAIRLVWVGLLGDVAADVGTDTSMWDIGAHSLMLTRLGTVLGVRVAELLEAETLTQQAALLAKANDADEVHDTADVEGDMRGEVAVIGIAVRWPCPEGNSIDRVIASLSAPEDVSVVLSAAALAAHGVPADTERYVRRGILLDTEYVESFDAGFFGMSHSEAELTDPNQRSLLEVSYEALIDAGYPYRPVVAGDTSVGLEKDVGVFACGGSLPQYLTDVLQEDTVHTRVHDSAAYWALEVGNDKDYCATRISHAFDLHGPAFTCQSACSSGLLCVANGMTSLRSGQCKVALIAASGIQTPQDTGYPYQAGMVWSVDGRCRPFDVSGSGTVPGNAVVSFVLKRLKDAEADGDRIYAVLAGCGVSNDGRRKHTFSAPSKSGQVDAVRRAVRNAGIDPKHVTLIEGHGTGTAVGDPIELAALSDIYSGANIVLGSVKGHIGHTNTAAGAAGLLKAVLSLHSGHIFPTANHTTPTTGAAPFTIPTALTAWEVPSEERVCGVSSFGVGGTNVHIICRGHSNSKAKQSRSTQSAGALLPVYGRSPQEALSNANALSRYVQSGAAALSDVHHTLLRRPEFAAKCYVVSCAGSAAVVPLTVAPRAKPVVVFCVPGQGGLTEGLGSGLLTPAGRDAFPAFAAAVQEVADTLLGYNPLPDTTTSNEAGQIKTFTLCYALGVYATQQLQVAPSYIVGHSIGEVVAAALAGLLSVAEAVKFVALRGRLVDGLTTCGKMVSMLGSRADVEKYVLSQERYAGLELSCINGVDRCVVSGPEETVQRLLADEVVAVRCPGRLLATDAAFHSRAVDGCLATLRSELETIFDTTHSTPTASVVSSVTGELLENGRNVDYWVDHMRRPVDFLQALLKVEELAGVDTKENLLVLELGPSMLGSCAEGALQCSTDALLPRPSSADVDNEVLALLSATARLAHEGVVTPDVAKSFAGHTSELEPQTVTLPPPTYSRQRCWGQPAQPKDRVVVSAPPPAQQLTEYVFDYDPVDVDVLCGVLKEKPVWAGVSLCGFGEDLRAGLLAERIVAVEDVVRSAADDAEGVAYTMPEGRSRIPSALVSAVRDGRIVALGSGADDAVCPETALQLMLRFVALIQNIVAVMKGTKEDRPVELLLVIPDVPVYAAVLGFARSAAREFPQLTLKRLVIEGETLPTCTALRQLIDNVSHSFSTTGLKHNGISAHEDAFLHAAGSLEEFKANPTTLQLRAARIRHDTYQPGMALPTMLKLAGRKVIVTGGSNGVGRLIVDWCVQAMSGGGEIVVLSRSEWAYPTQPPGVTVRHVRCDVTNTSELGAVMDSEVDSRLAAVFHSAGVVSDATIANIRVTEPDTIRPLIAAKVHAASVLVSSVAKLSTAKDPPVVYLTSSSSAALGPAGQALYAAANVYSDALVERCMKDPSAPLVCSLQWGGWEVGMTETHAIQPDRGEAFISRDEAAALFRRVFVVPAAGTPRTVMPNKIVSWRHYSEALNLPVALCAGLSLKEAQGNGHPLLGTHTQHRGVHEHTTTWPASSAPSTERDWACKGLLWMLGHKIGPTVVVPATLWVEMMVSAAASAAGVAQGAVTLEAVVFKSVLELRAHGKGEVELITSVDTTHDKWRVRVCSRNSNNTNTNQQPLKTHCEAVFNSAPFSGSLSLQKTGYAAQLLAEADDAAQRAQQLYYNMHREGFRYSGGFRSVQGVASVPECAAFVGEVNVVRRPYITTSSFFNGVAPDTVDACTHIASLLSNNGVPQRFDSITYFTCSAVGGTLLCFAEPCTTNSEKSDISVFAKGTSGQLLPVFSLRGLETVATGEEVNHDEVKSISWGPATLSDTIMPRRVVVLMLEESALSGILRTLDTAGIDALYVAYNEETKLAGLKNSAVPLHVVVCGESPLSAGMRAALLALWSSDSIVTAIGAMHAPLTTLASFPTPHTLGTTAFSLSVCETDQTIKDIAAFLKYTPSSSSGVFRCNNGIETMLQSGLPIEKVAEEEGTTPRWYSVGVSGASGVFESVVVAKPEPTKESVALKENEVLIEATQWALNFLDVLLATGVISGSTLGVVGGEVSGTVIAKGASVDSVDIGDTVAGLPTRSGLGNYATILEHCCHKVPSNVDPMSSPVISLAYGTAWYALYWLARIRPGERVLIHAAAGGVGQACVHLTKRAGAIPICTVSTQEKRDHLIQHCGVDPEMIFNSRSPTEFSTGVLEHVGGVDVIVNSLSGEAMKASLRLLKPLGRFVELGKADQKAHTGIDLEMLAKGQMYTSAHLDVLMQNAHLSRILLDEVWEAAPTLPPLPLRMFALAKVSDAMTLLNSGKHIGKIVIQVPRSARSAPQYKEPPAPLVFKANHPNEVASLTADFLLSGQRSHAFVVDSFAEVTAFDDIFRAVALRDTDKPVVVDLTADRIHDEVEVVVTSGREEVEAFLLAYVARRLRIADGDVDMALTLGAVGIDSLGQLQLSHSLRAKFGNIDLDLADDVTLSSIVDAIVSEEGSGDAEGHIVLTEKGKGTQEDTQHPRRRVLCLHGFRSSNALLKLQLRRVAAAVPEIDLVLVNAPHPATGPGDARIPAAEPLHEWWHAPSQRDADGTLSYERGWVGTECVGLDASLAHLREVVKAEGPFEGVLGHSQGGSVAEILLREGVVRWGVFVSSFKRPLEGGEKIGEKQGDCATLHIYDASEDLAADCAALAAGYPSSRTHLHTEGHDFKVTDTVLTALTEFFNQQRE